MKRILTLLLSVCAFLSCEKGIESLDPIAMDGFLHREVMNDGSFIIASSKEQLKDIFSEDYLGKLDLSKRNILLIYGTSNYGVYDVVKNVEKVNDKYCFELEVYKNWLTVMDSWCVVYSISKQLTEEDIEVQISYVEISE
jgi:hypothetical protein